MKVTQELQNVEFLNYMGSVVTNDARCTSEIKSRNVVAKATFNKKEAFFHQQIGLRFQEETREVLHLA
jgi:hypothetical protein